MQPRGFEEERTAYASDTPESLVGQFRRFGEAGPAYEVIRIVNSDDAWITVVYSGEELTYPIKDILQDPLATTVP